jgi:hypothetical protein
VRICMYMHVWVCMYMHVCVYACTCMCACVPPHVFLTYQRIKVCMYASLPVCMLHFPYKTMHAQQRVGMSVWTCSFVTKSKSCELIVHNVWIKTCPRDSLGFATETQVWAMEAHYIHNVNKCLLHVTVSKHKSESWKHIIYITWINACYTWQSRV